MTEIATNTPNKYGACQAHTDVHAFNDTCVGFREVMEVNALVRPNERINELADMVEHLQRVHEADQRRLAEQKAEMRQALIEALETPLEVDDLNRVLESLDMDPIITMVEVDVKVTMRLVVNITNNEDDTLAKAARSVRETLAVDGNAQFYWNGAGDRFEIRDSEDVHLEIQSIQQRDY